MNLPIKKRVGAAVLALVLTAGVAGTVFQTWAEASNIPSKTVMQSGVTVLSNAKAAVDTSNLSEGFIQVKYTGGKMSASKCRSPRAAARPIPIT